MKGNEIKPSIDVATRIADTLEVTLDFLAGKSDIVLDKPLTQKIAEIQKLPQEEKDCVNKLLDAFLRDYKTKKAYALNLPREKSYTFQYSSLFFFSLSPLATSQRERG